MSRNPHFAAGSGEATLHAENEKALASKPARQKGGKPAAGQYVEASGNGWRLHVKEDGTALGHGPGGMKIPFGTRETKYALAEGYRAAEPHEIIPEPEVGANEWWAK